MDRNLCFRNAWLMLLLASLMGLGEAAFAERKAQAGLLYGYSVPDAPNTAPYVLSGIKGSAFITPSISTGGYFLYSDKQGQPSESEKFRYSLHGIEGTYHMVSGDGDTYFSLRVGISKIKTNPTGVDTTFSPYHYGLATGYDLTVTSWLSLGFEGSYLHVQRGKNRINGSSVYLDSFNIMSFMISAQVTH